MANYTGGLGSVVIPGSKLYRPPVKVTQFWHLRRGFGARFCFVKPNRNKLIITKPNSNLNHFQQLLFHTIPRLLINIIFFVLQKKGAKTVPRESKLGYFYRRSISCVFPKYFPKYNSVIFGQVQKLFLAPHPQA